MTQSHLAIAAAQL